MIVLKEESLLVFCKSRSTYVFGKPKVLGKLIWSMGNEDDFRSFFRSMKCNWTEFYGVTKRGSLNSECS